MDRKQLQELLRVRSSLNDYENMLYTIRCSVAPIIVASKPSALINFTEDNRNMLQLWKGYRHSIKRDFSLDYYIIDENERRSLVLLYDEELINTVIYSKDNYKFLKSYGYGDCTNLTDCISRLKERFSHRCPHEIGVFLGYPLEDVIAFIQNFGRNYLLSGYWKVYHKPLEAKRVFQTYDKAIMRVVEEKFM